MAWGILLLAGLCEIIWAVALKYTGGFTRLLPSVGILAAMAASAGLLSFALKSIPVGTAYAVWTGIGVAGTAALGVFSLTSRRTRGGCRASASFWRASSD